MSRLHPTASLAFAAAALLLSCSVVNQPEDVQPPAASGGGSSTSGDGGGGTGGEAGGGAGGGTGGCGTDLTECSGECVDLQTNSDHCGGCDSPCGDLGCVGGACVCPEGTINCDGTCIDPLVHPDYCGASDDCQGGNAGEVCEPGTEQCAAGACLCAAGLLDCGGSCIDPLTDPVYCGAQGDCQGPNDGDACSPTASCVTGACLDTCDNCSFETGSLVGWVTQDLTNPLYALAVMPAGTNPYIFSSAPTDGQYSVVHGYDGDGPGTISFGQNITLANLSAATLRFDYRVAWDTGGASQARTFSVTVEPAGGGTPLQSQIVVTSQPNTNIDTGTMLGTLSLTPFVGQTVFIRFLCDIPESYTGPGSFELDHVRVTSP